MWNTSPRNNESNHRQSAPTLKEQQPSPMTASTTETAVVARQTTTAREHLVYVDHEPSQQRNQRKVYSDRNLPDHLLQNSYLYNTTPSEVSNCTDRKHVTDAKILSIKQEAHRIQYRIPRSTKTPEKPNVGGYFTKQEHSIRAPVPFNQYRTSTNH